LLNITAPDIEPLEYHAGLIIHLLIGLQSADPTVGLALAYKYIDILNIEYCLFDMSNTNHHLINKRAVDFWTRSLDSN
jgi:hypothetical protein